MTDLRIEARYNAVMRPLAITPFIATVIPTHRYETFGHAAPGRDLRELQIGTSIGRQLDPVLPRAFFDLRYGYSFAQEVAGINVDRNNVDLQVGYFLSLRLSVRAFGGWQRTREGIELPIGPSNPLFILHDRLQRTHLMRTGGAFSFSAGRTWDLYGFVAGNLSGKNTHSPLVVGIGITRTFGGRQDAESLTGSMSRSETEQRMLASNPMERLGLGAGASPRAAR